MITIHLKHGNIIKIIDDSVKIDIKGITIIPYEMEKDENFIPWQLIDFIEN